MQPLTERDIGGFSRNQESSVQKEVDMATKVTESERPLSGEESRSDLSSALKQSTVSRKTKAKAKKANKTTMMLCCCLFICFHLFMHSAHVSLQSIYINHACCLHVPLWCVYYIALYYRHLATYLDY